MTIFSFVFFSHQSFALEQQLIEEYKKIRSVIEENQFAISDNYYTYWDNNIQIPIGRFPARTGEQASNWTKNVIMYEKQGSQFANAFR